MVHSNETDKLMQVQLKLKTLLFVFLRDEITIKSLTLMKSNSG